MPIGILDSGVGGLTIWKDIVTRLPQESTLYLGDSKNCPYGTKTEEEIWKLTQKLVEKLLEQHVSLVVVACNTISVIALEKLRELHPTIPFIGTVPAIKAAVVESRTKRIGVLSTPRTAESAYQKKLLEEFAADCEVVNLGTNKLVPLVEAGELKGPHVTEILREVLQPFIDARIDTLVLGCTHFPFLKTEMQKILGEEVVILDSGAAIARQVERILAEKTCSDPSGQHQILTSGDPEQMNRILETMRDIIPLTNATLLV